MENQEYTKRNQELLAELAKYSEDSQEYRKIESEIVKNNERLVKFVANRAKRYYYSMLKSTTLNIDDLISDGYLGLLKAIKACKFKKISASFATYAVHAKDNSIRDHLGKEVRHITYSIEDDQDGDKQNLKDNLVSPVNMEEDIADKDETNRQMAWVRKNLDQLTPLQKQVFTARYLSGETMLKTQEALAKELGCKQSNISEYTNNAIKKLRKIYDESHPEEIEMKAEIELTNEEKIKLKEVLKNLIMTELTPMPKKTMLCKFYSPTQKTNEQVAEEIGSTQQNVAFNISVSYKKLCTLCDSIKDTKHLKNILEFRIAESGKER